MPIITLTTDFGLKDFYVSAIKGKLLTHANNPTIVDITHLIPKLNISQAAFILKNTFHEFPIGTIHLIGVQTEKKETESYLVAYYKGHYFIGTDNGLFSLLFDEVPEKIISIDTNTSCTFPTKDIFVNIAAHISKTNEIDSLGKTKVDIVQKTFFQPIIDTDKIRGAVIYEDTYGNAITNITKETFLQVGKNRSFTILFRNSSFNINTIHQQYNQVDEGDAVAVFNSIGKLEIAIRMGNAVQLLGLKTNDPIIIEFNETSEA
jgi:S-adenosyl-L-methionine hydrolase (adenosine-forming)